MTTDFVTDLQQLLNTHSRENGSNTPDFLLAQYLLACLQAADAAGQARERWYGRTSPILAVRSEEEV